MQLLPSGLYRKVICFCHMGVSRVGAHSFDYFWVTKSRFCPICTFFHQELQRARIILYGNIPQITMKYLW